MATGGQGQSQQPASAPPEKPFKVQRIALGIIGALLIFAAAVLGILATIKIIADVWVGISAIGLAAIGALITLFTWLWPFSADSSSSSQAANPSTIAPTISPDISPKISPDISPTISPTFNVTFSTLPVPATPPSSTISTLQQTVASVPSSTNTSTASAQLPQPAPTPASIFQFNVPLKDPAQFYGRAFERTKLITRIKNGSATAIAGERRIGKTWLLRYIQLVTPNHPSLGPAYRVGYLSGSNAKCKTLAGFVTEALQELKLPVQPTAQFSTLAQAVKDLSAQNLVSVLCIDEFEGFDNQQEFGLSFVEGLRSMSQDDGLVLILAGKKRLVEIGKDLTGTTSPFFNIIEQLTLKPFTLKDAEAFATDKATQANFSDDERVFLLENAAIYDANGNKTWPSLRLQLTGQMMLDDRQQANDTNDPECYEIPERAYQQDFKRRLNEQYQGVVKY